MKSTLAAALLALCSAAHAASEYSPNAGQNFPNRVLFGDTHLHTVYSTDAGMVGTRLGPDEAYRFAMGEQVKSNSGLPVKLARPLDFLVIADHAENLGLPVLMLEGDARLLATDFGKRMRELVLAGRGVEAQGLWRKTRIESGKDPVGGLGLEGTAWERLTAAAEKYNRPGQFTALIGFEWTSAPAGRNLHRNVIFRDGKDRADQIVPFSAYDSLDPELLWKWMADYERKTGGRLLAIPHNGNLSNGLMFDDVTLSSKKPLDRDYAAGRAHWEPVVEIAQTKGVGEAHPLLSQSDEFADFELLDKASLAGTVPTTPAMYPREYAREALKRGLAYEAKLGANPFKFGVIGSTDSHTALATTESDNFFSKFGPLEPNGARERWNELVTGRGPNMPPEVVQPMYRLSAAGLAAVWARENTREAIWDALARKEVYGTSGTRVQVRVFAGSGFKPADLTRPDWVANGYRNGVPMGGDLKVASGGRPALLVKAWRSPDGANLDRIQVVKGWLDRDGKTQERVYDVAWSGSRKRDAGGKVPAVGNTVDVKQATWSNSIGAAVLEAYWQDPEFKAEERALYYVRVLEIPTPRWTVYDARAFGWELPKDVPAAIQQRAWTSPIWYTPS